MPEDISLNSLLSNFHQNPKRYAIVIQITYNLFIFFELVLSLDQARISESYTISALFPQSTACEIVCDEVHF